MRSTLPVATRAGSALPIGPLHTHYYFHIKAKPYIAFKNNIINSCTSTALCHKCHFLVIKDRLIIYFKMSYIKCVRTGRLERMQVHVSETLLKIEMMSAMSCRGSLELLGLSISIYSVSGVCVAVSRGCDGSLWVLGVSGWVSVVIQM